MGQEFESFEYQGALFEIEVTQKLFANHTWVVWIRYGDSKDFVRAAELQFEDTPKKNHIQKRVREVIRAYASQLHRAANAVELRGIRPRHVPSPEDMVSPKVIYDMKHNKFGQTRKNLDGYTWIVQAVIVTKYENGVHLPCFVPMKFMNLIGSRALHIGIAAHKAPDAPKHPNDERYFMHSGTIEVSNRDFVVTTAFVHHFAEDMFRQFVGKYQLFNPTEVRLVVHKIYEFNTLCDTEPIKAFIDKLKQGQVITHIDKLNILNEEE